MSDLKALLETVVYTNSSDKPQIEPRTISVSIADDKKAFSKEFLKTINLSPVNDNPTLDLDGDTGSAKVGQDGAAASYVGRVHKFDGVKIAPEAEINLIDSDFISKLVVTLTNGVADNSGVSDELLLTQLGSDILTNKNLSISKDSNAGVNNAKITITGNESENVYNQILQNISFKSAETPSSTDRNITVEVTDVDKAGTTNKTNQKLDYTDPNNVSVISNQKQSITVTIDDNPLALVASGSKTLSLSISDNPTAITKLKVDLEGKEIKLGAERK